MHVVRAFEFDQAGLGAVVNLRTNERLDQVPGENAVGSWRGARQAPRQLPTHSHLGLDRAAHSSEDLLLQTGLIELESTHNMHGGDPLEVAEDICERAHAAGIPLRSANLQRRCDFWGARLPTSRASSIL